MPGDEVKKEIKQQKFSDADILRVYGIIAQLTSGDITRDWTNIATNIPGYPDVSFTRLADILEDIIITIRQARCELEQRDILKKADLNDKILFLRYMLRALGDK